MNWLCAWSLPADGLPIDAAPAKAPYLLQVTELSGTSAGSHAPPVRATSAVSGYVLLQRGQYQAAITIFEQIEPKSAAIYNALGIASEHMHIDAAALYYFKKALQLDARSSPAYNNLGTLYYQQKSYRKAEKCYRKSIGLDPTNASAELNLGTLYFSKKKYAKGEVAYRRALALNNGILQDTAQIIDTADSVKNKAEANFHLARLFAQLGLRDQALEALQKAVGEGFRDRKRLAGDPAFAAIKTQPAFAELLSEIPG